jgi:hypothetical protein
LPCGCLLARTLWLRVSPGLPGTLFLPRPLLLNLSGAAVGTAVAGSAGSAAAARAVRGWPRALRFPSLLLFSAALFFFLLFVPRVRRDNRREKAETGRRHLWIRTNCIVIILR